MAAPEFDYVIVGAGTAGCLLANRLSADPSKRVLLLEAGGRDNWHWIHIPVGYLYCIGNPRTDWLYKTEPDAGLNGRVLRYPRGRTLGGCSSINGMIYMRGQARDYEHWAAAAARRRLALGRRVAAVSQERGSFPRREQAYHSAGGEVARRGAAAALGHPGGRRRRVRKRGIPRTADFNTGDNAGVGYFEVNQKRGVRWNAAKACLKPIAGRDNFTLETGAPGAALVIRRDAAPASNTASPAKTMSRTRATKCCSPPASIQLAAAARAFGDRTARRAPCRGIPVATHCRVWANLWTTCNCGWWRRSATCARSIRCRRGSWASSGSVPSTRSGAADP
jgi:choline dehydrogenase-like flavoprotein